MTKFSLVCIAATLFFAACKNNNSSTVGTYEKEEETSSSDKKEGAAKDEQANKSEDENAGKVYIDSSKSISDSLSKKDPGVSLEKKNAKSQSKTTETEVKP